jgi:hypothetical protein
VCGICLRGPNTVSESIDSTPPRIYTTPLRPSRSCFCCNHLSSLLLLRSAYTREFCTFHNPTIALLTIGMHRRERTHYDQQISPRAGYQAAMSGFITTMFVSPSADHHIAFPAKPKPLLPIFTFAQSQSCMNLRMDLDVLDFQGCGRTGFDCSRSGLDVERPKDTYQSPLQRIGEALRSQQQASSNAKADAPSTASQREHQSPHKSNDPTNPVTNFSYTFRTDASLSTSEIKTRKDAALGSERVSIDTGSIIGPGRPEQNTPQNRGYFPGTSLLSFFSNPRTRAPFKPQKSNRGTSSWQLKQYAEATLGSGSLRKAVKLPEGEDKDEWLAVNGEVICRKGAETMLMRKDSGRLLQPDQPAVRLHHRVLLTTELS